VSQESLAKYRRLLPKDAPISDEELAQLVEQLSVLARAICASYVERSRSFNTTGGMTDDEKVAIEREPRFASLKVDFHGVEPKRWR